jgi:hypothetical protein
MAATSNYRRRRFSSTPQQIMERLVRTEPKGGAALMILRWLTDSAARDGAVPKDA